MINHMHEYNSSCKYVYKIKYRYVDLSIYIYNPQVIQNHISEETHHDCSVSQLTHNK